MDTLVITGSSGFIGKRLAQHFCPKYRVIGLDREAPEGDSSLARFVQVDFGSAASIFEKVRKLTSDPIASVIHLAAYYDFSGAPSPLYQTITVEGSRELMKTLQHLSVEQFIFSSSMLVHAPIRPGQRVNENSPLLPKWDYPKSKVEAERAILEERGAIPVVILRIAGVYDDGCHSIPIANQIKRIYEKTTTSRLYPGDVERGQSFVHLDDLVQAFDLAVQRRQALAPQSTFLIGEPETVSYEEMQKTVGRLIHREYWRTARIPKAMAKMGAWFQAKVPGGEAFIKPWMIDLADDHYELDISRARATLGWKPEQSLRDSLPQMIEGFKKDPLSWYRAHKLDPPSALIEQEKHAA